MLKITLGKRILKSSKYTHHCKISWASPYDNSIIWDRICIDAVELFGLPGNRYVTDITENDMTWSFASDQDALLFKLKFSEAIVNT